MILWIKQETANDTIRLEDNWSHSIYVAADNKTELKSILEAIGQNETITSLIKDFRFTYRNERITDTKESEVLKLTLSDSTKALTR
jgi:hypothetical protein